MNLAIIFFSAFILINMTVYCDENISLQKSQDKSTQEIMQLVQHLSEKVTKLSNEVESNSKLIEDLQDQMDEKTNTIIKLRKEINKSNSNALPNSMNTSVAFTALAVENRAYEAGNKIDFDATVTNLGLAYDIDSSIFKCPERGYYFFTLSVASNSSTIRAGIKKDGEMITATTADGVNSESAYNQGSTSVVVFCDKGQDIEAEVISGTFLQGEGLTSFSGFVINNF